MKEKILFIINFFAIFIFTNCISSPKEPRSIRATASSVTNSKDVRAIIQNYYMGILYDNKNEYFTYGNLKIIELIVARNRENCESICYARAVFPNKDEVRFIYLSINGEKTSAIKYDGTVENLGKVTVSLTNTTDSCKLDEKGHTVVLNDSVSWTENLVNLREYIKYLILNNRDIIEKGRWFIFTYEPAIKFEEPINQKQIQLMNKLLFQIN